MPKKTISNIVFFGMVSSFSPALADQSFDNSCTITEVGKVDHVTCEAANEPVSFKQTNGQMTYKERGFIFLEIFNEPYKVKNQQASIAIEKEKKTDHRLFLTHLNTQISSGQIVPITENCEWSYDPILSFSFKENT